MPSTVPAPHPVDEILPLRRLVPLAVQHVFVMAASPISAVFLVSQTLHLSSALTVNLLSATFILSGLGTILQSWGPWKVGSRLPFVMLPGGAPIVLFLGIAKEYDIRTAVGAVILAGAFYFVALPVFARLLKYFPTVVIGTMIVIIGVNLIRVSGLLITGQPGSPGFAHPSGVLLALATIGCTVLFFRVLRGGLAQLSVLLGLVAGTVIAFVTGAAGPVDGVAAGPVLGVPDAPAVRHPPLRHRGRHPADDLHHRLDGRGHRADGRERGDRRQEDRHQDAPRPAPSEATA